MTTSATNESSSPNPWQDAESSNASQINRLKTPDPSTLDPSVTASLVTKSQPESLSAAPAAPAEILDEFDPLADQAQKAWESEEGHPPPAKKESEQDVGINEGQGKQKQKGDAATPPPQSRSPSPPPKDNESAQVVPSNSSPAEESSLSPFPSLAALARSFSIPTIPRPARPVSLDMAKPVPSPNTLSQFASQQDPKAGSGSGSQGASPEPGTKDAQDHREGQNGSGSGESSGQSGSGDPPFDFQKFLDQMKTRAAEPVAKYLKSFLSNFAKRTFTTNDQIKIINDFLNFISKQMRECEVWRSVSDVEFDNAMEGMEKLVMNQLYQFTFTPAIAQSIPRRQVTTDDLERDRVLQQRIALFGWIEEKHLDVPEGEGSKGFLMFAEQELLKINHYKAPRDKLICLIRHLHKEEGADSFVPILIFVVLKANPDHLLSNVEFINRFRNPEKLQSEAGYYLSSLMGAVSFIETMDHTSLSNITQEEFERNVEDAIQALPASEQSSPYLSSSSSSYASSIHPPLRTTSLSPTSSHAGEESAQPLSLPAPPPTNPAQLLGEDARRLLQKTGDTISKPLNAISRIFNEALDSLESNSSNTGRATPTSSRMNSYLPGPFAPFELGRSANTNTPQPQPPWVHPDEVKRHQQTQSLSLPASRSQSPGPGSYMQTPAQGSGQQPIPIQTPYKPRVKRVPSPASWSGTSGSHFGLPASPGSPGYSVEETPTRSRGPYTNSPLAVGPSQPFHSQLQQPLSPSHSGISVSRTPTPSLDLTGMQAEIDNAHEQAAVASRETLAQIFPSMDREVLELVLEANGGDLGKSIESLLEMS
ncbi:guanine nucleotide exchange factor vps9 [Moniliophthora roreri]|nr:guanine nucleotide exchange factor vps9 [Moniliophthora roreri]